MERSISGDDFYGREGINEMHFLRRKDKLFLYHNGSHEIVKGSQNLISKFKFDEDTFYKLRSNVSIISPKDSNKSVIKSISEIDKETGATNLLKVNPTQYYIQIIDFFEKYQGYQYVYPIKWNGDFKQIPYKISKVGDEILTGDNYAYCLAKATINMFLKNNGICGSSILNTLDLENEYLENEYFQSNFDEKDNSTSLEKNESFFTKVYHIEMVDKVFYTAEILDKLGNRTSRYYSYNKDVAIKRAHMEYVATVSQNNLKIKRPITQLQGYKKRTFKEMTLINNVKILFIEKEGEKNEN
ncbi:hypothetical protein [Bacillus thuringiensis]|nr:hypothetical protein [Bacillus thuringiensis]